MHRKTTAILAALAVLGVTAVAAHAAISARWSAGLQWHVSTTATRQFVFMRQLGTEATTGVVTADDTHPVAFDAYGQHIVTNSSPYAPVSLARFVPKDAKAVRISVQAIVTHGPATSDTAAVYAFARPLGSAACPGPAGNLNAPADFSYTGNVFHNCEVAHALQQLPNSGVREWSTFDVAVHDQRFEFSWGYRQQPGDAVAVGVYIDGYAD